MREPSGGWIIDRDRPAVPSPSQPPVSRFNSSSSGPGNSRTADPVNSWSAAQPLSAGWRRYHRPRYRRDHTELSGRTGQFSGDTSCVYERDSRSVVPGT